ncbi:DUF1845 domain-containing protein [Paraburkholderia sp. RAU2J]|uniref:DUF1845 domain-containing protein n=1 Tax=Paraburkholderia sp. RAU2J TaxID=1938810 RepID=UPI000EAC131C|nr:DUF1845 domain-containing protein [Paraburkholderia sp. RAU2J]
MAAVLEQTPEPDPRPAPRVAPQPDESATAASGSGLKPIDRLTSDSRLARINPDSDAKTVLSYSSQFARNYIRSDYNFCAAKIAVARGGKVRALESALRETSEWLCKTEKWLLRHQVRPIELPHDLIELTITRPLAGLLVRCLTQYDRVYARATERVLTGKITGEDRAGILNNAERRLKQIVQICMPDNDQYDFDGERREQ